MDPSKTASLETLIHQLNAGENAAKELLLARLMDRFYAIASRMLRRNPKLCRWEMTDDILQATMIRVHRALDEVKPGTVDELLGLVRLQISRELTDLARKYYGPMGIGRNHATDDMLGTNGFPLQQGPPDETHGPEKLSDWVDFHAAIEQLDEPLRIVFQMSWYQMLTHEEMALALKCSTKTIQRRFREACWQIKRICESIPGER